MDSSYTVRPATVPDAPAIVDLLHAAEQVSNPDVGRYTPADVLSDWHPLDLERDTWLIVAPGGALCGYATSAFAPATGRFFGDGYTHPDHLGRGIGTYLLGRMRARAEQAVVEDRLGEDGTRLVLANQTYLGDAAQALLTGHGYQLVRVYHEMRIDLEPSPPAAPAWPAGIGVRICDGSSADIRRAYDCIEDSFVDHWGRARREYEHWTAVMVNDDFDPALWFFAEHDGAVVGAALCRIRELIGDVNQLGVIRSWRRRGLGEALLRHTFGQLHRRGLRRVELGVDSASLTGADRLYRRAGMMVAASTGRFEIELRPGLDLLASTAGGPAEAG